MEHLIDFWFPNNNFNKFWFDGTVDNYIIKNYKDILENNITINYKNLSDKMILSYIILYDQFSRNIYRNINQKDNIKKYDKIALELSEYYFNNRKWLNIPTTHLVFYLIPYRHTFNEKYYNNIMYILNCYEKSNKINNDLLFDKFKKHTLKNLNLFSNHI